MRNVKDGREIECWDLEGEERLHYTDKDEAIEYILDNWDEPKLPESIEICGYIRMSLNEHPGGWAQWILELVLERLDEEYGDPDEYSKPTEEMTKVAKRFMEIVCDEYTVWAYEIVTRKTVNVREWCEKHRPDFLEATDNG